MVGIPYRYLTLWHEERILKNTMPKLKPGEAAFRSYYLPSMEGGKHTIKVEQRISLAGYTPPEKPKDTLPPYPGDKDKMRDAVDVEQQFTVIAPHFKLIEERVDSVFPPPGHSALPKTLPHIVLKDYHFPWARNVAGCARQKDDDSNRIPWVALITFTADELQVSDMGVFGEIPGAKLNENLAVEAQVGLSYDKLTEAAKTKNMTNLTAKPDQRERELQTSLICLKKPLFTKLFGDPKEGKGNITQFKYMNHVREVSTEGQMAAMYGPSGLYSIIVSNRTGLFDTEKPTPLIAHLVSLENIDGTPISSLKDNIILTSLYSWTYTSLPPGSFDVRTALQNLGDNLTVLYPGIPPPNQARPTREPTIDDIIKKRQEDGYTLVRHRTKTGEETAAMYRGPLVPTIVPPKSKTGMTVQSNFGTDLQILDADLGLMDISYAAAWQLGKTLAMGDPAFTAALSRVRRHMHIESLKTSQINVHKQLGEYVSRDEVLKSIPDLVHGLDGLNSTLHANNTTIVSTNRWQAKSIDETVDITLMSPHIFSQIYENAVPVAMDIACSTAGPGVKYNYHNVPSNTDYAMVQSWIHDKLHMASIPAHYFIPDKSYLPDETLRFFYIDENWTDALIDGALSLANQFTFKPEEDFCRLALKEAIGDYLRKEDPNFGYSPQMPKFGFLMRTNVLVQFPELTVVARFDKTKAAEDKDEKPKAPILVQRKLAPDIMLCLFDYAPPQLWALKFTLPAQQQCYTVGSTFDKDMLKLDIKRIFAPKDPNRDLSGPRAAKRGRALKTNVEYPRSKSDIFDWESRTIKAEAYAKEVWRTLRKEIPPESDWKNDYFEEEKPTSAMMALQLNEPIYTLDINKIFTEDYVAPPDELFQFNVPVFPAHKYKPPPLPKRVPEPRLFPQKLVRPTPEEPPIFVPNLLNLTPSKPAHPYDRARFIFKIYTLEGKRITNYVPTAGDLPIDLVFSITTDPEMRPTYNYQIKRLTIKLKQEPFQEGKTKPLLDADYEPDPPSMLSNLRFNIFTNFQNGFMKIELVPRSKNGVPMKEIKECSFMLGLVIPYAWKTNERTWVSLEVACIDTGKSERDKDKEMLWQDGIIVNMGPEPPAEYTPLGV
ncbi:hypothetical protein TWF970_005868 [Orbilia oligospora]|uniref:Uncharacterized protein n=1 Tax=Orbilia oligospora TaxID=2813651 RepID=A0A7C8RL53_ORBOL|nr:hypothetical protein TWF970_005868 [Orbilia oligospora]